MIVCKTQVTAGGKSNKYRQMNSVSPKKYLYVYYMHLRRQFLTYPLASPPSSAVQSLCSLHAGRQSF